ncbi:uncharacterized protein [Watersipora subatra]|uniref:uncharacterized protein n=1 Tax=Watersipora subatra TaxID=2589382 RepID=UPI00355B4055
MLREETEDEVTMFDGALLLGSAGSNKKQKQKRGLSTFALCGAYIGVGLALAIPGPTLNYLRCHVGATIQTISYIFPARSLGYLVGSAVGGFFFDKFERRANTLVSIALLLAGLTIAIAPWTSSLMALCVLLSITSVAMGFLDTGGNVLILRLWEKDSGPYLQLLHFAFGLGACISPLVAAPLLSSTELSCNTTIQISDYTTTIAIAAEPMHKRQYIIKPNASSVFSNSSSNTSFSDFLESLNSSSSSSTPLSTSATFLATLPLVGPKPNTGEATSDKTSFSSASGNDAGKKLDEAEKKNKPSKVTSQKPSTPKTELTGNTTSTRMSVAISFDTSSAKSDNATYDGTTDVTGLVTWVSNGSIVAGAENNTATNIYESDITAPIINASTTGSGVDLTPAISSLRTTASQPSVLIFTEVIAKTTTAAAPSTTAFIPTTNTATAPEALPNSTIPLIMPTTKILFSATTTATTRTTNPTTTTSALPTAGTSTITEMVTTVSSTLTTIPIKTSSLPFITSSLKPFIDTTKRSTILNKLTSHMDWKHDSTTTNSTAQSVLESSTELVTKPDTNSVGDGDGRSVYEKGKELLMSISKVQFSYLFIALVLLLFGFVFCCLSDRTDSVSKRRKSQNDLEEVADLMMAPPISYKVKIMSAVFIFFFLYVGTEVSYGQFIATFSIHHNGFTESTAAYLTAIYWGMFALARGLSVPIAKCLSPTAMLTISLAITLCSVIGLTIATATINSISALWVLSGGLGVGMAAIFPTGVLWLEGYIKVTGKMAAVFVCASALGEMVVPAIVGFSIDHSGPMTLMYTSLCCVLLCALTFFIMRCITTSNNFRYKQVGACDTHSAGNAMTMQEFEFTDSDSEMSDREPILFKSK